MSNRKESHTILRLNPVNAFIERYLYPIDTLSETFFSLLIVLLFTLAYRIFSTSNDVEGNSTAILFASLGAVIAWGFIDGVIYGLLSIFEREERIRWVHSIQSAPSEAERVRAIATEFEYVLEPIIEPDQQEQVYKAISQAIKPTAEKASGLEGEDVLAGIAHVVVALYAVLPSLVPFILLPNRFALAVQLSNGISFVMLFITGYRWGKYTGVKPIRTGLIIMVVGILLALLAIPLGGK